MGSDQTYQVPGKPDGAQEGKGKVSRRFHSVLESKKKGSEPSHVIGMEVSDEEMGDGLPPQAQPGHGSKSPIATIQEQGGSPQLYPMGWGPPFRIRD
jgi:hypothetical protein